MKRYLFSATFVLLLFSANSFAVEFNGKVKALYINSGGTVLVAMENGTSVPECGPGLWQFSFQNTSISGKEWFSMLLTARAANTSIIVGYVPNSSGSCDVGYFYYLN